MKVAPRTRDAQVAKALAPHGWKQGLSSRPGPVPHFPANTSALQTGVEGHTAEMREGPRFQTDSFEEIKAVALGDLASRLLPQALGQPHLTWPPGPGRSPGTRVPSLAQDLRKGSLTSFPGTTKGLPG